MISDCPQAAVDLPVTATLLNDKIDFVFRSWSTCKLSPVIEQDAQLFHIVDSLSAKQRVSAARIVADHSTNGATIVSRRIGRERQVMNFCPVSKRIQHYSGLNPRNFLICIDLQDVIHVLCEVEHYGDITALSRQTCSGTARQDRSTVLPARLDRRDHILHILRDYQSNGNLPVVGSVGCIQRATAAIKAYFTSNFTLQLRF